MKQVLAIIAGCTIAALLGWAVTEYWDILLSFLHVYLVHACLATALMVAADVHQNGVPPIRGVGVLLSASGLLGSLVAILTSVAHVHIINYVLKW